MMNRCLKISCSGPLTKAFLETIIQQQAHDLAIEGIAQILDSDQLNIIACGTSENIEQLLDVLHKEVRALHHGTISVEPFLKVKDYRGVFRIID
jgi:acylphosphatase